MHLKRLNTKTDTFIIGWIDDNADKYELVKIDRSPQTEEAKDSALPPGSVADYVDSIVGPIEGHAQSVFAKNKPLYEELLRLAIRLRQIIT